MLGLARGGRGRRGGTARARGRARRQPGGRAAAKSRLGKLGAADMAAAPAQPKMGQASGRAEAVPGKRKRQQTRKAAYMATMGGMFSDEDPGGKVGPEQEQQQQPPAKCARRAPARAQPPPSTHAPAGVPSKGPEQPYGSAVADVQAALDPPPEAVVLPTPGKHGWGRRGRRSKYSREDGHALAAPQQFEGPETTEPANGPTTATATIHVEDDNPQNPSMHSLAHRTQQGQSDHGDANASRPLSGDAQVLSNAADNLPDASAPSDQDQALPAPATGGADEIPDTPAATPHDPPEPSVLGKRGSSDHGRQLGMATSPGSPSGWPRKMVKLSKRPGLSKSLATAVHATQCTDASAQAVPIDAAGLESQPEQPQLSPPRHATPKEQAADDGMAGTVGPADQVGEGQPRASKARVLQPSAEPADVDLDPAGDYCGPSAAAKGSGAAAQVSPHADHAAADDGTAGTPAEQRISAVPASSPQSHRSGAGASARAKSSRGQKSAQVGSDANTGVCHLLSQSQLPSTLVMSVWSSMPGPGMAHETFAFLLRLQVGRIVEISSPCIPPVNVAMPLDEMFGLQILDPRTQSESHSQ